MLTFLLGGGTVIVLEVLDLEALLAPIRAFFAALFGAG